MEQHFAAVALRGAGQGKERDRDANFKPPPLALLGSHCCQLPSQRPRSIDQTPPSIQAKI